MSRVTQILEESAVRHDGVTLNGLVAALGAPKSSVHGLVRGLITTGYLREEGGRYFTGPAVAALLGAGPASFSDAALPVMRELNGEVDETVMLGSLVGGSVVYVAAVESSQRIRYSPPLNQRRPLWPTSTGKCFLAYMSDRRRVRYLDENLPTARHSAVETELARVREEGVAFNRGETLPDISAAASPVLSGGHPTACLALAGPSQRLADALTDAAGLVRAAASELSARTRSR